MKNKTTFLVIIPARFKSTRFPGKLLKKINGKSILKHVWDTCIKAVDKDLVLVATDHQKISNHCHHEDMNVLLTSPLCKTGTDRVYEVSKKNKANIYINVQGDEPMLKAADLRRFIKFSLENQDKVVNAMTNIKRKSDFHSPNVPKVVVNGRSELLYISRASIPLNKTKDFVSAKKQVCIYSFPRASLQDFGKRRKKTALEQIEDIEIIRFLEMGYKVKMFEIGSETYSIDTPEDLKKVRKLLT